MEIWKNFNREGTVTGTVYRVPFFGFSRLPERYFRAVCGNAATRALTLDILRAKRYFDAEKFFRERRKLCMTS